MSDDIELTPEQRLVYTGAGGKLHDLHPVCSRIVRIFVSSTFTDTTLERNALMKYVYPEVKKYCRNEYGLEFQVVDMRWGVRDESTDDHKTTDLCMKEIERCQRMSVGPSFMLLLGQKYGYRPIPSKIDHEEFNRMRKIISENPKHLNILDTWYILDNNADPPVAVLQPISSILVNYNNKRYQSLMDTDREEWWRVMGKLQAMLRKAALVLQMTKHLDKHQVHNYFTSVTEREVLKGILNYTNGSTGSLAYVRLIDKMDKVMTLVKVANFIDMTDNKIIDEQAQGFLKVLRDDKLPKSLPKSNIEHFNVDWSGEEGIDSEFHAEYLQNFCRRVNRDMMAMIDAASIVQRRLVNNKLYGEVLQSLHQCHHFCSCFQGRGEIIDKVKNYIIDESGDNTQICVLHGASGCGKTSLLAKSFSKVFDWLGGNEQAVMIIRFLGTSPDSSSVIPLLTSISKQITCNYSTTQEETPCEFSPLVTHFRTQMKLATAAKPLVIFLDSLDQLSSADGGHGLAWMPRSLPEHVHFVVSTLPVYYNILDTLQDNITEPDNFIEVKPLGENLSSTILKSWLKEDNRTVTDSQWKIVQEAISKCNLPLFVKLVYDEIVKWRSYSTPESTELAYTIHDSIHRLFDRVQITHGLVLVSRALGYLTAAKSGLSSSELEDILSLDEKVLNDVYQYHLPPERRIPSLLWTRIRDDLPHYFVDREADGVTVISWYHRQFIETAKQRYFRNINFLNELHSQLADYFLGIWGGGVEKPFECSDVQKSRFPLSQTKGAKDRMVPKQPLYFLTEDSDDENVVKPEDIATTPPKPTQRITHYNLRKLNELPYHLIRCNRFKDLFDEVLFNFKWLHAKLSCMPLQAVLSDFEDYLNYETNKEVMLVADAIRLSASVLSKHPNMLGPQIVGRLLPYIQPYANIRSLVEQCDSMNSGLLINAITPAYHCLHTPGGPLQFSLESHPFAPLGIAVTSDNRYLVSVSSIVIIWDLSTGGIFKEVPTDKPIQGIMKNLSLSPKDKYSVSYTNSDQIVVVSLESSSGRLLDKVVPLGRDGIAGTVCGDETFVVWTHSKWYLYTTSECSLLSVHESNVPRIEYNTLIEVGLPISPVARQPKQGQQLRRKCSHMVDNGQRYLVWKVNDPILGIENDSDLLLQSLDVKVETGELKTDNIDNFFCHSSIAISADGNTIYTCISISDNDVVCYVKTPSKEKKASLVPLDLSELTQYNSAGKGELSNRASLISSHRSESTPKVVDIVEQVTSKTNGGEITAKCSTARDDNCTSNNSTRETLDNKPVTQNGDHSSKSTSPRNIDSADKSASDNNNIIKNNNNAIKIGTSEINNSKENGIVSGGNVPSKDTPQPSSIPISIGSSSRSPRDSANGEGADVLGNLDPKRQPLVQKDSGISMGSYESERSFCRQDTLPEESERAAAIQSETPSSDDKAASMPIVGPSGDESDVKAHASNRAAVVDTPVSLTGVTISADENNATSAITPTPIPPTHTAPTTSVPTPMPLANEVPTPKPEQKKPDNITRITSDIANIIGGVISAGEPVQPNIVPDGSDQAPSGEATPTPPDEPLFEYEWRFNRNLGNGNTSKLYAMSLSDDETCLLASLVYGFKLWKDVKPTSPNGTGKCPNVAREKPPVDFALPSGTKNSSVKNTLGCMATLTDGNKFLVAAIRNHIYVWNTEDGSMIKTLDMHFMRVLALLPIIGYQRVISSSLDKSIKIWNLDNINEEIHSISRHEKSIEKLYISKYAATTTRAGVGIWDLQLGKLKKILAYSMHSALVTNAVLNKCGDKAISSENEHVILWDTASGDVIKHDIQKDVVQILLSEETTAVSKYITVSKLSFNKYQVVCRKLSDGESIYDFEYTAKRFRPVIFSNDGINMIIAKYTKTTDQLGIYHTYTGTLTADSVPKFAKFRPDYSEVICMPNDSNRVALIDTEKASIWDIKKHSFIRTIQKWNGVCTSDGKYGLYAPNIGGFSLIDLKSGKIVKTFTSRIAEGIFSVKTMFTNDDKYAVYYHSVKRCVRLFRVSDARLIGEYMAYADITSISISPAVTCNTSTPTTQPSSPAASDSNGAMFAPKTPGGIVISATDGTLTVLVISDPECPDNTNEHVRSLDSRRVMVNGQKPPMVAQDSSQTLMAIRKKRKDKFVAAVQVAKLTSRSLNRQKSRACNIQ